MRLYTFGCNQRQKPKISLTLKWKCPETRENFLKHLFSLMLVLDPMNSPCVSRWANAVCIHRFDVRTSRPPCWFTMQTKPGYLISFYCLVVKTWPPLLCHLNSKDWLTTTDISLPWVILQFTSNTSFITAGEWSEKSFFLHFRSALNTKARYRFAFSLYGL